MPTPKKERQVEEIKDRLSRCTIAVATGYQGMSASNMTDLRARLREQGIEYRVIKNTLTLLAANELGKEGVDSVLQGPTALALGYGDVVAVAKGINGYITTSRMPLVIHG
ncbi:MAG: 50S ribosomal protein L10, partial [Dehalococcoidia bacterium]|nr:50S ribosomal protein L10 [Dehalococcoidia bacterium]